MQINVGSSLGVVLLWSAATLAVPQVKQATVPIELQVLEVVSRLEGTLMLQPDSEAAEPQPTVQMTSCRVEVEGAAWPPTAGVVLYQEQAAIDQLSQPYRQRFLRIGPTADGSAVESLSFRPRQPEQWVGLCQQPMAARVVTAAELEDSHCRVVLRRVGEDYVGGTPPEGCPGRHRGAVRVTNQITLSPNGMTTFDQGFDANGNLVWGTQGEPYRFHRTQTPP